MESQREVGFKGVGSHDLPPAKRAPNTMLAPPATVRAMVGKLAGKLSVGASWEPRTTNFRMATEEIMPVAKVIEGVISVGG